MSPNSAVYNDDLSLALARGLVKAAASGRAPASPIKGPVLVAVSGGGDSVALLHLLHEMAPSQGWELAAAHVDHGLRPESGEDAGFVERLCRELGLKCLVERITVEQGGLSPEEAARRGRRKALLAMAEKAGADVIALGHTADDQAETLMMRIISGTGPTGLAAMRPYSPPFWRPLLGLGREDLRNYLKQRNIVWRTDPSNQEMGPLRNRVRHKLLPLAKDLINPRAVQALCRLASLCADEEEYWAGRLGELGRHATWEGQSLCLDAKVLSGLSRAEARRWLRWAVERVMPGCQGLALDHMKRLLELSLGQAGKSLDLPGGLKAYSESGALRLDRADSFSDFTIRLDGPSCVYIKPLGRWLEAKPAVPTDALKARGAVAWLPGGSFQWPITVRPPREGERFHPLGAAGSKRLSRFFIDQKIPAWWRLRSVVVADNKGPLWVGPWSVAQRARKKKHETHWLRLRLVDTFPHPSYT